MKDEEFTVVPDFFVFFILLFLYSFVFKLGKGLFHIG